jgi:hypothetical protein
MQSTEASFTATDLESLPQEIRQNLLDGPVLLLVVTSSCEHFDYVHQCFAAKDMVGSNRMRQLGEQSESNTRPFAVEFSARALAVASPIFKQSFDIQSDVLHTPLHMGNILPGYAMCVLDWYGRALRSRNWHDFLRDNLPTEDSDRWYWIYCYAAMRLLGMNEFAARLQDFIKCLLCSVVTDWESHAHLLRALSADDTILSQLAQITTQQMKAHTLQLTNMDQCMIAEHFPHFAAAVNAIVNGSQ